MNVCVDDKYTQGDSDVISMPAVIRRHLVGNALINVFHCDSAEIRFVGKIMIIKTFLKHGGLNVI